MANDDTTGTTQTTSRACGNGGDGPARGRDRPHRGVGTAAGPPPPRPGRAPRFGGARRAPRRPLSSDVERTIGFYQDLLELPLTEVFENRDYQGSTHFFFDIGNGNALAFFDFPGLDLGPYAERLGGLHHLAISVEPERWQHLRAKLRDAGVPVHEEGGTSLYFQGPDGERIELIADPLGEMYGSPVM